MPPRPANNRSHGESAWRRAQPILQRLFGQRPQLPDTRRVIGRHQGLELTLGNRPERGTRAFIDTEKRAERAQVFSMAAGNVLLQVGAVVRGEGDGLVFWIQETVLVPPNAPRSRCGDVTRRIGNLLGRPFERAAHRLQQ